MIMKSKKIPLVNRELSWLSFNDRVLQEAEDENNPLIERLRFLGIYSNNRDEFFRVRVATLKRMTRIGKRAVQLVGEDPETLLEQIQKRYFGASQRFDRAYQAIILQLEQSRIFIRDEHHLTPEQGKWVNQYFRQNVLPSLFPIMLDSAPSFPYLKDKSVYLAIKLVRSPRGKKPRYALMEIPTEQMSRFVVFPSVDGSQNVMLLEDLIRYCLHEIFPKHEYTRIQAYTIKLTRDAELDIDNDVSKSLLEKISGSLKKRKKGEPVRFVYDRRMAPDLLAFLKKKLRMLGGDNMIAGSRYHNFKDFISFPDLGHKELVWPVAEPMPHPAFARGRNMFRVIRTSDVMLHYPYQSFHHIIDLLRVASIDPRVLSIQITIYRVSKESNICNALINAVKNGKKVVVVMELQARFDEENNIYWSNRLQEEGATVIFGVPGIKVHSKLFLITRREEGQLVNYAHVGTGNMNESTSRIYTDKSLLTVDPRITGEVQQVFGFYHDNLRHGEYKHLLVSPFTMRKRLVQLIDKEIHHAKKGREAWMLIKLNNLVDRDMITKLYEASEAGVKVNLIVRGICSLVPGVEGFSTNIKGISVVGRYLEHSRVFIFCNGGDEKYFISSADWMTRNLDFRSEVAIPVFDTNIQKEMKTILDLQWKDNTKARVIGGKHENEYVVTRTTAKVNAQQEIRKYLSKSGRNQIGKKRN
jgi:polyphosphate kinase